jgi:methyltransferase (TIGR00027 family)
MRSSQPSRTALGVARRRAAHQIFDRPLVFADPLAIAILGPGAEASLRADLDRHRGRFSTALRAFVVARARATEDEAARAAACGVRQFVILGAGLDTFAYRNPSGPLHVFEVDHPATQAWKREALETAHIAVPPSLTFAPVDFERETLAGGLAGAGFDPQVPALFSWLGVTMYLTGEAFGATLGFIASQPAGSAVVFDYAADRVALSEAQRLALSRLEDLVAAAGEPFRTFFEPGALRQTLADEGFTGIEDLGADELNARYFSGRADGLHVSGGAGRLVIARR